MKKRNKKLLFIVLIAIALFIPLNTNAQYKKAQASSACKTHKSSWDTACGNKYGITIESDPYSRKSSYNGNGDYTNEVKGRKITITANSAANYRVRIIKATSEAFNFDELNFDNIDDLDSDDIEDATLVKRSMGPGTKNPDGKVEYELKPGNEVLVIVYLVSKEDSGERCTTDDRKEETVYCKNGKSTDVSSGTAELTGVSASLFIENPNDEVVVENLRKRGKDLGGACDNAYNGVYQTKNSNDNYVANNSHNYTLKTDAERIDYRNNFYTPILGSKYCDLNTVAFNLGEKQIARLSNKLLKLYNKNKKMLEKIADKTTYSTLEAIDNEINELSKTAEVRKEANGDSTEITGLQCDAKATTAESKNYLYVKNDKIIKTDKLSTGETPEVCRVRCYEHLTVKYSPPVATKAGLCFTYKVTVKSKTNCGIWYNTDLFTTEKMKGISKDMCAPVPVCSNDETHTQAGPSEEFDKCVNECDGGKYSQTCINKCYNKVYKKNTKSSENETKASNMSENYSDIITEDITLDLNFDTKTDLSIEKMSNFTENQLKKYWYDPISKCNSKNEMTSGDCIEYFYKAKALYPKGHYNEQGTKWQVNSSVKAQTSNDYNDIFKSIGRASPYYLRSKPATRKLINALLGKDEDSGMAYGIDNEGIKRLGTSGKWRCVEKCEYAGCTKNNALTPSDFISSYTIEEADVDDKDGTTDDRKSDLDIISDALDQCIGEEACDKNGDNTSTFEIKIDNPRTNTTTTTENVGTNKSDKNDQTGSSSTKSCDAGDTKKVCNFKSDCDNKMFVKDDVDDNSEHGILGDCYGLNYKDIKYQTTITFPGAWINLKTGDVSYYGCDKPNSYLGKPGYFCSAYDSVNENSNWWKWKVEGGDYADPEHPDNIKASAKNFGKYKWNINLSCFYAIYNKTGPSTNPPDENTKINNYSFKIINLQNAENNLKGKSGTLGYNWTSAAQIKNITNTSAEAQSYAINPETYLSTLKNEKYDDNDKNSFDYYFELTDDDLNNIRNENKNRSYSSYNGFDNESIKTVEGIPDLTVYKSDILDKLERNGSMKKRATTGINNS